MIHCNLAALLAERRLKITKVFQDTGISRTTLTSLAYGHAQGIQFDTMNTLCSYLRVGLEDLINYVPTEVTWTVENGGDVNEFVHYDKVVLTIKDRDSEKKYPMCLETTNDAEGNLLIINLAFKPENEEINISCASEEDAAECISAVNALPVGFITDILNNMITEFSSLNPDFAHHTVSFTWPFHNWD